MSDKQTKSTPKKSLGKYYVYQLIDPRDNSIFYIGKGCRERVKAHVSNFKKGVIDNLDKHLKIQDIIQSGYVVEEKIVAYFHDGKEAYIHERELIEKYKSFGLTNYVHGLKQESSRKVSDIKKSLIQLQIMRKKIRPFHIWVNVAGSTVLDYAFRTYGSYKKCYDNFIDELDFMENILNVELEKHLKVLA